jgi:Right handed beta helix region
LSSTNAVDIQGLEIFGSYDGISVIGDSQDVLIRNNVVHDVQYAGIAAFAATQKGINNVRIDGNTVYRTNRSKLPPTLDGLNFTNNLWFGGLAGIAASPTDVTANPLLANPGGFTAQDYQILAGSPAIDQGSSGNAILTDAADSAHIQTADRRYD